MKSHAAPLFLFAATAAASADIINVPDDWPTIQLAINNSMPGDEIVIAPGKYVGSFDTFGHDLTIRGEGGSRKTTVIGDDVAVVFVATGESVTLDGLSIRNPGGRGIFIHNVSTVSLIDCQVVECIYTASGGSGAGVHVRGSSVLNATNCEFTNNRMEPIGSSGDGGAVAVTESSNAIFANCLLVSNMANRHGGAIHVAAASLSLDNCELRANTAGQDGGAVHRSILFSPQTLTAVDTLFRLNNADNGGALYYGTSAAPFELDAFAFECNSAATAGGAIHDLGLNATHSLLTGCSFTLNSSPSGGAVYTGTSNDNEFSNCTFCGNQIGAIKGLWIDMGGNEFTAACLAGPDPANCDPSLAGACCMEDGTCEFLEIAECGVLGGVHQGELSLCAEVVCPTEFGACCLAGGLCEFVHPESCDDLGGLFIGSEVHCQHACPTCEGDVDGDGEVSVTDLVEVVLLWETADPNADINDDGVVDVQDMVLVIVNWGSCP